MGGQQAGGPFAPPVQVLSQQEAAVMGELQQTEQKIQSLQSLLDLQTQQQLQMGADAFAQAPSLLQQQQPWQTQWQQPQSLPTKAQSSLQQRQLAWQPQWQPPQPSDVQEQLKEAEGRLQAEIQEVKRTQQSLEASEQRYAASQAELQAYRNYVSPMSNNVATQVAALSLEAERKKFDDKDKALRLEQEKLKAEFQKTESTQKDLQQSRGEEKLKAASLALHVEDDAASKSPEVKQSGIIKDAISKVETIAHQLEDHVQNVGHTVADKVETVGQSVGQRVKTLGSMMMPQPQQEATQQQARRQSVSPSPERGGLDRSLRQSTRKELEAEFRSKRGPVMLPNR